MQSDNPIDTPTSVKVAWLFPGQGSQEVGMGLPFFEQSAAAREVFEQADRALGEPLRKLCFEGPLEELTRTANTQPALVTTSCAIVAALRERFPNMDPPTYAAGHSLGEYSALVAAGAIAFPDAVRMCRVRGLAMQDAVPEGVGTMAAIVGLPPEVVLEICAQAAQGEIVSPANYNAPGQIVIAGNIAAVSRAGELVDQRGGKAIALKVSAPFHCALMKPAADKLSEALAAIAWNALSFPVIANQTARPTSDAEAARSLLIRQIDSPVRWVETVHYMVEQGVTHALELGPGKVLAGLVKRIHKGLRVHNVSDMQSLEQIPQFLAS